MRAEQMVKEYKNMKRELQITQFQLSRFEGVSETDMIHALQFSHPGGERVQTSSLSDKTAKVAINYKNIVERENDEWFNYFFHRYKYLKEELDFFEQSVSALSGVLPDVIMDLLDGELTWENIAGKYHVTTATISKYKKKALKELEEVYEMRDRQTENYILG